MLQNNSDFQFYLLVNIAEMERTQPWLSFPGTKIKIHRLVVELQHFENLIFWFFSGARVYIYLQKQEPPHGFQ